MNIGKTAVLGAEIADLFEYKNNSFKMFSSILEINVIISNMLIG